jgi:hypothetical protein
VYSFGNVGRNSMTGTPVVNLDATVACNFAVTERLNLQLRGEFFNLATLRVTSISRGLSPISPIG